MEMYVKTEVISLILFKLFSRAFDYRARGTQRIRGKQALLRPKDASKPGFRRMQRVIVRHSPARTLAVTVGWSTYRVESRALAAGSHGAIDSPLSGFTFVRRRFDIIFLSPQVSSVFRPGLDSPSDANSSLC